MKKNILTFFAVVAALSIRAAERPNIVLIMADDLGYECISANGANDYLTPNIDRLAAGGIRFKQCFSNPKCTPSRVKIMTGLYGARNYVEFGTLDRSQTTFAHQLKQAGYATAIAGKWQLGRELDAPTHFGFDQACLWQHIRTRTIAGRKGDTRYPNPHLEINGKEVDFNNGEYGPDICAKFICDFIETNKDRPFLAYYPMILPHWPFEATPDSADWDPKSMGGRKPKIPTPKAKAHFVDMVAYVDKIVGQVVDTLERNGLRENTLIIFTGDNGTEKSITSQWSGRDIHGGKGQATDEGTRVALVFNWPGRIQPEVNQTELVEFSDVLPTLCETERRAVAGKLSR